MFSDRQAGGNEGAGKQKLPLVLRQHYGGDDFEPDNLPARASLLSLDSPQEHDFGPAGDVDWVYLPLDAGTTYFIETRDLADGVDTSLALFAQGAYDTPLAENDDCSGYTYASCLSFTPATSGRYELRPLQSAGAEQCGGVGGGGRLCD